jgi:hypothetical protein
MDVVAMTQRTTFVWGLWSEADYYGPHLQSMHATEESARAEAKRRNDENWPERPTSFNGASDWYEAPNADDTTQEVEEALVNRQGCGGTCDGLEIALEASGFDWWVETREAVPA